MSRWIILFITCLVLERNYGVEGIVETEESLREDLLKLFEGQLKFNDDTVPRYEGELDDVTPKNEQVYDFVVIGAGTAGATIASRLSEIKDYSVLLIEAGSKEYPIMDIPLIAPMLQLSEEINWGYETEPSNKYCVGFENSRCLWPRGRVMGGNSVLNFMVATRGNKRDFDNWANITGDASWSYNKMLHYLKKLENYNVTNINVDEKFHNKSGPIYITSSPRNDKLTSTFIDAGEELGYPVKVDYNGDKQIGFTYFQSTIRNGERWSVNRGYLYPAKKRKNLHLTRNSRVSKILINEWTKMAYGVQFQKFGKTIRVFVRKEVILSAGAINSPQILMLSGIGPAGHLRDLGIEVVKNAPVGRNLMDHIAYSGLIFKVNDSDTYQENNIFDPNNPTIRDYVTARSGSLAYSVGFEALAYVNVDSDDRYDAHPNIELLFGPISGMKDPLFSTILGVKEEYKIKMMNDVSNHSYWNVWPMICKPKSRGKLLLQSKNPNDKPKLYPNYLDDPDDVRVLIKGIRKVIELSKTESFRKIGSELYDVPLPCESHTFDSDSYWECALRTYTSTIYHQSGTCKMGRRDDPTAVVDPKLRVIGIGGLRVCDASVMPEIVSAHPNIPIVAMAEKISDVIKERWHWNFQEL